MKKVFIFFSFLAATMVSMAQDITVFGKVTNNAGAGIEGISVVLKRSSKGTVTKADGTFSITAPSNGTLIFSGINYSMQEVPINNQSFLTVALSDFQNELGTVVVTALGIQRKAKSLTYSHEEVKASALTAVPETNIMNSLQGKVAGLNTYRGSGGAGSSVTVVIRGNKSFANTKPLYVIDGIPFQNNSPTQPGGVYNGGSMPDGGDNLSQLNPDDIESMITLKGAGATALYGSQGQNGVVLITTKKGKAGSVAIDYSLNYNIDKAAYGPDLQNKYGQQSLGSNFSWDTANGTYNDPQNEFFVTGNTLSNSVSLKGGNKDHNSYLSFSNTHANNIFPNSNYNKNTITFKQNNTYFNGKLTADASIILAEQHYKNPLSPGLYNNPLTGLYLFPRNLNFNEYKENYELFDSTKNYYLQNWWNIKLGDGGDDNQQNPFWILNRDIFTQKTDKIYGSLSLKYNFTEWLNIQLRGNIDKEFRDVESKFSSGTQKTISDALGNYRLFKHNNQSVYGDAMLTLNKKIGAIGVVAIAGTSITSTNNHEDRFSGPLKFANIFSIPNIRATNFASRQREIRKEKQAVFGSLNLSYKDYLFVDLTARNDWSSALAYPLSNVPTKSYFYPSFGLSNIVSDMVKLPELISFWKLRASYAVVGNDFDPYQTYFYSYFSENQNAPNTINASGNGPIPGTFLKPEKTNSIELGTELRLKNDLIFLDFTWFKINTKDQLIKTLAPQGGQEFDNYLINAGNIQNTGIELSLGISPVKQKNLKWDVYATLYTSKNVVKEFSGIDNDVHGIDGSDNMANFGIKKGLPYPTFFGKKFKRDADGNVLIDTAGQAAGSPLGKPLFVNRPDDTTGLGSAMPRTIIGIRNTITINNRVSIGFLIDGRFGGQIMDVTQAILDEYGVSKASADARDNSGNFMPVKAVYVGGGKITSLDPKTWYSGVSGRDGIAEYYMTSATNVRLRELSITYALPNSVLTKTKSIIKGITLGLNARNLFFFYKKAAFDPDIAVGTTSITQGYNAMTAPGTRSFGALLKVSF